MVTARAADVEHEVVGVDEELGGALALEVVEGGHRRQNQRTRTDRTTWLSHNDPETVALAETRKQICKSCGTTADRDPQVATPQLFRRVHFSSGPFSTIMRPIPTRLPDGRTSLTERRQMSGLPSDRCRFRADLPDGAADLLGATNRSPRPTS
jgi:hypothetical protein